MHIVTIENIKEIRSGPETRYYREQFKIAASFEERWLTLIYITDGKYKTIHMVAFTSDVFRMWNTTLRKLYSLRQDLMTGLGNMERRQMVWEKQYWKDADQSGDQKLDFEEVEAMCKRLNINSPRTDLLNRFMVRLYRHWPVSFRKYASDCRKQMYAVGDIWILPTFVGLSLFSSQDLTFPPSITLRKGMESSRSTYLHAS